MEGVPPLPPRPDSQPSAIVPLGPGPTYVVQAPKDQIFRVPPPENALLVEQYRDMVKNKKKTPTCYSCLAKGLAVALLVLIVCLVTVFIFYLVVGPADPTLSVTGIESSGNHKFVDVTVRATNPSRKMVYYFEKGGSATLSFHQKKVASGETQSFGVLNQKSEDVELLLRGSEKAALPKEIEKSLKGSKDFLDLSLSVDFSVRSSIVGIKLFLKQMNAECDIRVSNLVKGAHIVSQKCHAKFQ